MAYEYEPIAPPVGGDPNIGRWAFDEFARIQSALNNEGWRDITGQIQVRGTGPTDPSWSQIGATAFSAYDFSVGDMCWLYLHVPHDIVPNSEVFLHAHWVTDGTDTNPVKWEFTYSHANGFDQEAFAFGSPGTATAEEAGPGVQYQHMVTETAGIDMTIPEPDGLIALRCRRVTNGATDNADNVFLLQCDVHYLSNDHATPGKAPDFYR